MPPEIGNIAPSSQRGSAIKNINKEAITQLIKALLPAICALIKGLKSQPEPTIPPAAAINTLVLEISRLSIIFPFSMVILKAKKGKPNKQTKTA